jgi:hypothetical protein
LAEQAFTALRQTTTCPAKTNEILAEFIDLCGEPAAVKTLRSDTRMVYLRALSRR